MPKTDAAFLRHLLYDLKEGSREPEEVFTLMVEQGLVTV